MEIILEAEGRSLYLWRLAHIRVQELILSVWPDNYQIKTSFGIGIENLWCHIAVRHAPRVWGHAEHAKCLYQFIFIWSVFLCLSLSLSLSHPHPNVPVSLREDRMSTLWTFNTIYQATWLRRSTWGLQGTARVPHNCNTKLCEGGGVVVWGS